MPHLTQRSSTHSAPRRRARTPAPGPFGAVLALQRMLGNRAVSWLVRQIQRQPLDTTPARQVTTRAGVFHRFPERGHHSNQTDRPRFMHPRSAMQKYTGTANNDSEVIHPAVATDLDRLMTALRAEGTRLDDESLKQAVVASGWRPSEESEGHAYLKALRKTIRLHPDELPTAFPESLVETAKSELGTVGSTAHNAFRASLAAAPGWNQARADFLITETAGFKAPRGGSTHHSGVVVDIDFPYVTERGRVEWHGTNRERNADAFQSAAGQWLAQHAPALGFDSYDTHKEIWHMEWRNWQGTAADPAAPAAPAPVQAPAAATNELQDTDVAIHRAARRLLRAVDTRVPKGLSEATDARPLPPVAALPGADTATVKADKTAGGWEDSAGWTYSGTVGAMQRILLDGLPGNQQEQPAQKVKPPAGAPSFARATGKGPSGQRGRAVAIVPPGVTKDKGPVAVVVHLHGNDVSSSVLGSMGMRSQDRPEDVADFQIPQQVEAFVKSRPGARVVVLMPIGVTVPAGKGFVSTFGIKNLDAYVGACLQKLGLDETPDGIYLSAHSGGGFTVSNLMSGGLPKSVRGVFGFESFHKSDLSTWTQFVQERLKLELKQLQKVRTERKAAGASEEDIDKAQIQHLRDSGFRFAAFGGGHYVHNVRDIRSAIIAWFDLAETRRDLKKAMGGTIKTDVLRQLWLNFQASDFEGSTHMNALSLDSHFGQALASLGSVGALAPAAPPAPSKPAPARPAGAAAP